MCARASLGVRLSVYSVVARHFGSVIHHENLYRTAMGFDPEAQLFPQSSLPKGERIGAQLRSDVDYEIENVRESCPVQHGNRWSAGPAGLAWVV